MNKGTLSIHTDQFDRGEVRFGIDSPGPEWTRLDGSTITPSSPLWNLFLDKGFIPRLSWSAVSKSGWSTNQMLDLAFGGGNFVGVGAFGILVSSINGGTWTARTSNFGSSNIRSVAFGNGLWVAGGAGGTIRTSTDTITWTTRSSNALTGEIYTVTYQNNLWFAQSDSGGLRTSTDAITWDTRPNVPNNRRFNSIRYGNGIYVAGCQTTAIQTSTDGITWIESSANILSGGEFVRDVQYLNGFWYLITPTFMRVSTDLVSWATRPKILQSNRMVYANNCWVLAGSSGNLVMSTDTYTWTTLTSNVGTSTLQGLAYGNGIWAAIGDGGATASSTNYIPSVSLGNNVWGWIRE